MVVFGTQVCGDLSAGGAREWLVPDGVGGYAMGTVCGLRTRRYHGLLMVAEPGRPARRRLALAALDPVLTLPSGARVSLGVHEWSGGVIGPEGHLLLEHFELVDGLPRWRWRIGEVVIERELAMVYGAPQLGVVHRLVHAPGPVTLTVKALVTWRDAHGERGAGGPQPVLTPAAGGAIVEDAYRLRGPGWRPAGEWYRGVYAREEAARGLNPLEDLWFAGDFTAVLAPGGALEVEAWAGEAEPAPASVVVAEASERNRALVAGSRDETDAVLVRAADAFIVRGPDVVAGYPWFGTWSRDTMIAYEGLFLATGRAEEGRRLLHAYAATLSRGMLANTADTGQTDYNTVDATLWFMHAVERHVARTQDEDLADELLPALQSVVAEHVAGTRFNIVVDPADALLRQGAPGTALTWMDARVDGVPVTWRSGKPVEVNALWVNGLAGVAALQRRLGCDDSAVQRLHDRASEGFAARFPAPRGWLYDVVDSPEGDDASLRPNQFLAYSLPYAPLRGSPPPAVIGEALLTPLGPRTLAPDAPGYRARHRGGPADRDLAYHQGTVWPWLIGPYADATGRHAELLAGIEAHLSEWGVGSVSETAEGDPPHRATGCPFQAWSVAETLRVRRGETTGHS